MQGASAAIASPLPPHQTFDRDTILRLVTEEASSFLQIAVGANEQFMQVWQGLRHLHGHH